LIQLDVRDWCCAGSVLLGIGQLLYYRARGESISQNKVTASKIIMNLGMQCPTVHALI